MGGATVAQEVAASLLLDVCCFDCFGNPVAKVAGAEALAVAGEEDYPKILRRLPELLTNDSQILACLNAPHFDESFLIDLFMDYQNHGRLPYAPGFEDLNPAAALKCFLFSQK